MLLFTPLCASLFHTHADTSLCEPRSFPLNTFNSPVPLPPNSGEIWWVSTMKSLLDRQPITNIYIPQVYIETFAPLDSASFRKALESELLGEYFGWGDDFFKQLKRFFNNIGLMQYCVCLMNVIHSVNISIAIEAVWHCQYQVIDTFTKELPFVDDRKVIISPLFQNASSNQHRQERAAVCSISRDYVWHENDTIRNKLIHPQQVDPSTTSWSCFSTEVLWLTASGMFLQTGSSFWLNISTKIGAVGLFAESKSAHFSKMGLSINHEVAWKRLNLSEKVGNCLLVSKLATSRTFRMSSGAVYWFQLDEETAGRDLAAWT